MGVGNQTSRRELSRTVLKLMVSCKIGDPLALPNSVMRVKRAPTGAKLVKKLISAELLSIHVNVNSENKLFCSRKMIAK